jgi:hypothetical protein
MSSVRFVLRTFYTVWRAAPNRRCVALPSALLLAGCSMSVPGVGDDAPATTGSVPVAVDVRQPLPETLAYSDASRIGQAAAAALWQGEGANSSAGDWVNAATGSSGTLEQIAALAGSPEDPCRGFDTVVTSIGGVHRYSGRICRKAGGVSELSIAAPEGATRS